MTVPFTKPKTTQARHERVCMIEGCPQRIN